jgi:hypothetical protein
MAAAPYSSFGILLLIVSAFDAARVKAHHKGRHRAGWHELGATAKLHA